MADLGMRGIQFFLFTNRILLFLIQASTVSSFPLFLNHIQQLPHLPVRDQMSKTMVCITHGSVPTGWVLKCPGKNILMCHLGFRIYLKKAIGIGTVGKARFKSAHIVGEDSISRGTTSKPDRLNNSFHLSPIDDTKLIEPSLCDQRGKTHFHHNYVASCLTIIIFVSKNC